MLRMLFKNDRTNGWAALAANENDRNWSSKMPLKPTTIPGFGENPQQLSCFIAHFLDKTFSTMHKISGSRDGFALPSNELHIVGQKLGFDRA